MPIGFKGFQKGQKFTEEHKRKISVAHKGKKVSEETKKKLKGKIPWNKGLSGYLKGRIVSKETRKKMSLSLKGKGFVKFGKDSPNWRGGVTSPNDLIRKSIEYKLWRDAVFARDGYTCRKCNVVGGYLHAHHILNFSSHKKLRFAIDNGITLCKKHHKEFHKIYGNRNNTQKQIISYTTNT